MRILCAVCLCLAAAAPRAQGTLRVESTPSGARVVLNDVVIGGQPTPAVLPVAEGEHRVRVVLAGYATYEETVQVRLGAETVVRATLVPAGGRIVVQQVPAGATVTVNGQPYDADARVPVGSAEVAVRVPGRPALTRSVRVEADRETAVVYSARATRGSRVAVALVPGVLQMRDGRRLTGAAMSGLVVGGLATAAAMTVRAGSASDRREASLAAYEAAQTEAEAVAAREVITEQIRIQNASQRVRSGALIASGVVYTAALIDALARHISVPMLDAEVRSTGLSVRMTGTGAALALHF